MVHKGSNQSMKDIGLDNVESPHSQGIHKYESTSSWLDEYDNQIDKMHSQLDKEYEESAKRQEEAEARIEQLQAEEEFDRLMEEERVHQEEMRRLEVERAKVEVEAVKEQIKRMKQPPQPFPSHRIEEIKPTLKQKIVKLAKTVGGIAGAITGHPEVGVISSVVPEGNGGTSTRTVYKQPQYSEQGELVYGSW